MASKTSKMRSKTPPRRFTSLRDAYHHPSIDFPSNFHWFLTLFRPIFQCFLMILVVHFCMHFSNQFLVVSSMFFLSKIQMCCSAESLKNLISHWFLQCFVKVAFFRSRQSKHQFFTESSKFRLVFSIENCFKNRWEIDIFQHSESDPVLTQF